MSKLIQNITICNTIYDILDIGNNNIQYCIKDKIIHGIMRTQYTYYLVLRC